MRLGQSIPASRSGDAIAKRLQARVWAWTLAGVVLLALLPRLYFVQTNPFEYDETNNLMFATLAKQGYVPYQEVFVGIAPFALMSLEWSAILWDSAPAVRWIMMVYGLLGVIALFAMVSRQAKTRPILAGALAALLFSFTPLYFAVSTTINLEAAAVSFALLSLWAMEWYRDRPASWRLVLSGLLFGLSLAIKVLTPFVPGVILVQMVQHWSATGAGRRTLRDGWPLMRMGMWWAAGALAILAFFLLLYGPALVYQQVVDFRLRLRDAPGVTRTEGVEWLDWLQFLPLLLGAGWGVVRLRRNPAVWIWVAWFVLSALFLFNHMPLRPRHLVTVLPALAALSGMAVAAALAAPTRAWVRFAVATTAALVLVWMTALAGTTARVEDFVATHPARSAVLRYIRAATMPADCVISKENRLNFLTERLTTPYLSEVSSARLMTGLLTASDIMAEIDRHDCAAFVNQPTIEEKAPELRQMALDYFSLHLAMVHPDDPDYEIEVFAVPPDSVVPEAQTTDYRLGDQFRLRGWWLTPGPWPRDRQVQVTAYWEALRPPDTNYKIFLHLVDAQENQVQSFDHYPFELREEYGVVDMSVNARYLQTQTLPGNYPYSGLLPTQLWLPGHTLKETHSIVLPADLPPGQYSLRLGMYDEGSMARLPVFAADETDLGYVSLGSVEIQ